LNPDPNPSPGTPVRRQFGGKEGQGNMWLYGEPPYICPSTVRGQPVGAGLAKAYRPYASSVCDMNSAATAAVCGLRRNTSVIYVNAYAFAL